MSWGPWITHDGNGCPDMVRGRFLRIEFMLVEDCIDGHAGDLRLEEGVITDFAAASPMWDARNAGKYGAAPPNGDLCQWGVITRFQIWKTPGMSILRDIADNPEGVVA